MTVKQIKSPIRVVSGLAVLNSQILMGLRKPTSLRPKLWELPGGKIDTHEVSSAALAREWKEELGVSIFPSQIGPLLAVATIETEDTYLVELYPVIVEASFSPKPLDHVELRWVDPEEAVKHMPCSPAYYLHYRAIAAWVEHVRGAS